MTKQPTFVRSADTSLLVTLFSRCEIGDTITYKSIEQTIGRSVQSRRSPVLSALKILEKENGFAFECIPNVGYKRLDDTGKVRSTHSMREKQHRISRRAVRRLSTVNTENLQDSDRRDYYTQLSLQGAMEHATTQRAQKTIAAKVNGGTQQLAIAMTLKALAE